MGLPNFLVIGDVKAGSTSFYSYLRQHPDVYMPVQLKELRYFAYDADNPYHVRARSYRVRTFPEYRKYFDASGGARAVGEASPNYLRSPGAARRISEQLPGVRIIVCLRNPVERLYSLHLMHARSGAVRVSFEEHLFGNECVWIKGNACWPELLRYFRLFPRERVHVVLFDDLTRAPREVVRRVYGFLGVDCGFVPDLTPQNVGGVPRSAFAYSLLIGGKRIVRRLGEPSPALRRAWSLLKSRSLVRVPIDPQVRRKVLEVCREDIERTEELIGRDLSMWLEYEPVAAPIADGMNTPDPGAPVRDAANGRAHRVAIQSARSPE